MTTAPDRRRRSRASTAPMQWLTSVTSRPQLYSHAVFILFALPCPAASTMPGCGGSSSWWNGSNELSSSWISISRSRRATLPSSSPRLVGRFSIGRMWSRRHGGGSSLAPASVTWGGPATALRLATSASTAASRDDMALPLAEGLPGSAPG
nr:unnamed protein product [Digitaria exilis]